MECMWMETMLTTNSKENYFHVKVELLYRDYQDLKQINHIERTIVAPTKAEAYLYVKYYCEHYGIIDCIHRGEGIGHTDDKVDLDDPLTVGVIEEIIEEEPGLLL